MSATDNNEADVSLQQALEWYITACEVHCRFWRAREHKHKDWRSHPPGCLMVRSTLLLYRGKTYVIGSHISYRGVTYLLGYSAYIICTIPYMMDHTGVWPT
jgi:hypothetical protein